MEHVAQGTRQFKRRVQPRPDSDQVVTYILYNNLILCVRGTAACRRCQRAQCHCLPPWASGPGHVAGVYGPRPRAPVGAVCFTSMFLMVSEAAAAYTL